MSETCDQLSNQLFHSSSMQMTPAMCSIQRIGGEVRGGGRKDERRFGEDGSCPLVHGDAGPAVIPRVNGRPKKFSVWRQRT